MRPASRTSVANTIGALPGDVARSIKICLFRIVQEGLNNAFRHAGGCGQQVTANVDGDMIVVTISDRGSHAVTQASSHKHVSLGLIGLRRRVELLQGTLEFARNGEAAPSCASHCQSDRLVNVTSLVTYS